MKHFFIMLTLLCMSFVVKAELSFELLSKLTDAPESLQGHFEQNKHIKQFKVSIQSKGDFYYQRNKLIRWSTQQPIANELLMTPTSITSQQQGQQLINIDAEQQPTVKVLSQIFFAVLTAEWQSLSEFFYANGVEDGSNWHVDLTPKTDLLKQSLTKVTLTGDSLLREVSLSEPNGDTTHIVFSDLHKQ